MSKKTNKGENHISNYFITDHALNSAEFDEFGHVDYALLLEKLIREQPTPFNIGIFGRWGVGKSTIVNLLKERLEIDQKKGKTKVIEVKVWKYDENSLRRKFILKIAEGLGLEGDLDEINRDIYFDKEFQTAILNFEDILHTIFNKRSFALWGIIVSIVLLLVFRLINIIGVKHVIWNFVFQKTEDLVVYPLAISLAYWIFEILKKAKIKIKQSKYDSEEQFENEFIKLIKRDKSKKVIFIDDLDRCSKEKVVKTLETIKTFLDVETCIFIIACDDEIIIDAINRTHELFKNYDRNEGAEYLEKFFQYTIYIPPFNIPDMRKYIRNILKRNKSDLLTLGETLEEIIFILINKDIKSPRNAITTINNFSAAYLLAKEREGDSSPKLHSKIITSNLPILAVVIRIKYHFPQFYEDLLKNNDIIFWLLDIRDGNKDHLNESQLQKCEKYFTDNILDNTQILETKEKVNWDLAKDPECEKLLIFLESIKDYLTIKNISPFLFLGIDSTSYLIGDEYLQDFNDSIKNGIDSRLDKILTTADETKREYLFDHACDWIQDHLEGVEKKKALQSLSKQMGRCPNSRLNRTSKTLSSFYHPRMKYEEYKKLHPSGILICAKHIEPIKRNQLLSQMVGFINHGDIEHDKITLNEILRNEPIIESPQICSSVRDFLDKRGHLNADSTLNTSTSVDFEYVKQKILEYKDDANVLMKFFSGNIVDEVIENLIRIDSMETSPDSDDYLEAKQLYEIIQTNVLVNNLSRLCATYKKLIDTQCYYKDLLKDIESRLDQIPFEEIDSLAIPLINSIPNYLNVSLDSIERTFQFTKLWLGTYPVLADSQILTDVADHLSTLLKEDDVEVFKICVRSYAEHYPYFKQEHFEKILSSFINLLAPLSNYERTEIVKKVIIAAKDKLSPTNKHSLLNLAISNINSTSLIRNEISYFFWQELFTTLIDIYNLGEIDALVMPDGPNNIFSWSFPESTNDDRNKFSAFVITGFAKLSINAQTNFFGLLSPILSTQVKANAEFAISLIHKLINHINTDNFKNVSIDMLIKQFDLGLDSMSVFKNIKIIYSFREILQPPQISNSLQYFSSCVNAYPEETMEFLLMYWHDFQDNYKFLSIKELVNNDIIEKNDYAEKMLEKIKTDFTNLQEDGVVLYVNNLEDILKSNTSERDFFAKIIKYTQPFQSTEFKERIKSAKIVEIKSEQNIELCRNKFSILIGIKSKDYEKDRDISDLFFLLLNDTYDKKKLAIDVFEYYYEEKYPYSRKVELTELFNSLFEILEEDYKRTIKRLATKYDLRVRKSLFDYIFGN